MSLYKTLYMFYYTHNRVLNLLFRNMPSNTPENWTIHACVDGYYLQNNHYIFQIYYYPYYHTNVHLPKRQRNRNPYKYHNPSRTLYLYRKTFRPPYKYILRKNN